MALKVVEHKRIRLRDVPDFSEKWLHDYISDHPSILGLGELDVVERERVQQGAGRLDMLLADGEGEFRYEVEIMLGATDPSHIIRCIEYWDIERRRYPAYEHVAVLVAEEVTSRFLNVMSLLAGSIPLVAIQLNALRINEQIVLDFVKVLDQRVMREDETSKASDQAADRETWQKRVGGEMMKLCDSILEIANEKADGKLELSYQKGRVRLGVRPHDYSSSVAALVPKKSFLKIWTEVADSDMWLKKLEDAGVEAESRKPPSIMVRVRPAEMQEQETILRELIHQAVRECEEYWRSISAT